MCGGVRSPLNLAGDYSITLNGTCSVIKDGKEIVGISIEGLV